MEFETETNKAMSSQLLNSPGWWIFMLKSIVCLIRMSNENIFFIHLFDAKVDFKLLLVY